ncbi:MAG TPA: response regulator transcription factor [Terriglobales bacterium]|nr:response regulator transcription factor [Terriglobales bacterium]
MADSAAMSCHLLVDALRRTKDYQPIAAPIPRKALRLMEQDQFDVVLIGIGVVEDPLTGTGFIRQVQSLDPNVSIIALVETRQRGLVVEALRSGARGVFCRSDSFEALCKCIRCVHAGQIWASSTELQYVIDALVEHGARTPRMNGSRPLSKREEQITRLVADGCSNRQISERLGLSEHTVKNYLFRVFEKLGVSTRVGLTLYALKQGHASRTRLPSLAPMLLPDESSDLPS